MTAVDLPARIDQQTGELILDDEVRMGTLQARNPTQLIDGATAIATPLGELIEKRGLYSTISGKRYVRCEGWTTLAAMLGATPHEVAVTEDAEGGTFTATVEFRRLTDGQPITRASAECGMDESLWAKRPRYARRSMAITRATAKASRMAFSWIMVLAGYEATPSEEMPHDAEDYSDRPLPTAIPFGKDKGKAFADCSVEHLERVRDWCIDKDKFPDVVQAIDQEILSREESDG